jgi:hypothetical protein
MATRKQMNTTFNYDWGQEVRLITTATINTRPGQVGSICGMRKLDGKQLYLVEFSDGEAIEITEELIKPVKDARTSSSEMP